MVELPQAHLSSDILSHSDDGDTENGETLVGNVVLLLVEMVVAVVKHALNLKDVSGSSVGADIGEDNGLLGDRVRDGLEDFDGGFRRVLSTWR